MEERLNQPKEKQEKEGDLATALKQFTAAVKQQTEALDGLLTKVQGIEKNMEEAQRLIEAQKARLDKIDAGG